MKLKNMFISVCTVYTVITIFSSILSLAQGYTSDTHFHLLARFVVTFIGIGSFYAYGWFKKIMLHNYLAVVFHYVLTMALVFLIVYLSQFIEPLAANAYRDIFFNFTALYLVFALGLMIKDKFFIKKENNNEVL